MSRKNQKQQPSQPPSQRAPASPRWPVSPRAVPSRAQGSRSLEEERHHFAWKRIQGELKDFRSRLDTEVQGLPVALRTQGLGVTVATLLQRDREESRWLADTLAIWLLSESPFRTLTDPGGEGSLAGRLLETVIQSREPISATAALREAIAVASALKRISSALEAEAGHDG